MPFATIDEALEELRAGRMIILVDDENRENEGDLVCAGSLTTPGHVNFMAHEGRGWICLAMDGASCDRLHLPQMVPSNESRFETAFTVTIEARHGTTTGISAAERAHTIRVASNPDSTASDLIRPGHVQPIRARDGGVLVRTGQTEGSVDLMKLAGLPPAAVICEIMNPDGTMARLPDLETCAQTHNLRILSVAQIIEHRRRTESLVTCESSVHLPTDIGEFRLHAYHCRITGETHLALTLGDLRPGAPALDRPVLLRVHSECLTGDVFHSRRCDCGEQLHAAMQMVQDVGEGMILYMRQEGRGIGLGNKLRAYALQEQGMDTVEANEELGFGADLRDYGLGAQILRDLGVRQMRLITNNPRKIAGLSGYDLSVVERVPLVCAHKPENTVYLSTKRTKLGHLLDEDLGETR